jgi:hypothetical protein
MSNIKVVDFAKKEAMGALYCDHHGLWGNPAFRRFGPNLHLKGGYSVGKSPWSNNLNIMHLLGCP